jgi:curved DNA-binding protein
VPTPSGTVSVSVPPGTSSGAKLRIKGHGVAAKNQPAGDLFAEVQIVLPKKFSDEDREAIQKIDQHNPLSPRENLRW